MHIERRSFANELLGLKADLTGVARDADNLHVEFNALERVARQIVRDIDGYVEDYVEQLMAPMLEKVMIHALSGGTPVGGSDIAVAASSVRTGAR